LPFTLPDHVDISIEILHQVVERPLPMLLEVLRSFLEPPDDRWQALGPVMGGQYVEA
jgi:hypothetical protein